MRIVQQAAAFYILFIFLYGIFLVVRAAITGDRDVSKNITGFPALLVAVAVLICVITTLAETV